MNTGSTNQMVLTPIYGIVRTRIFANVPRIGVEIGHSRSLPAELDSTFRPRLVKPVAPTELPTAISTTALPLEPARAPVPGAIPG
jgi:hypothetical protein